MKVISMTPLQYADYPELPLSDVVFSLAFMKNTCFVPLAVDGEVLRIALADCDDLAAVDAIEHGCGYRVQAVYGRREDILAAIERLYGVDSQSIDTIIDEADRDIAEIIVEDGEDENQLRDLAQEAPIIRLVNRLIATAVEQRASDIHFEPYEQSFRVRYRHDGLLREVEKPPPRLQAAIISRIKIMARLDISERRRPQDGRIKLKIADRFIDFRVSTIPTQYGESLVMRILDRDALILDLAELGFPASLRDRYERLIRQPYGMILVTGPTGSGKTSTLYTTLEKINSPQYKIMTLEDPIEYQLEGINQIQVNPKIDFSFASGLRSIVRQDPDIILVGEIRDQETASIAIQSALTGHLLFSTLHTNDATSAITRLLDMGVESYLLSSTLLGILAQRLVRVICPHCKREAEPESGFMRSLQLEAAGYAGQTFFAGAGCEHCHHTGYAGRTAIFEYLEIDEDIRTQIDREVTAEQMRKTALAAGMTTLRGDGLAKAAAGMTTLAEVLRVTLGG